MDEVFRALADASRRRLLDRLNVRNGQSLRELSAGLDMTRQSVSKHLAVLEAAGLVTTTRRGREKLHHLNAAPINAVADRWIGRYDRARAQALADLQAALEGQPMEGPTFVYTTYIRTTPERLWTALTAPEFTRRYWGGVTLVSDWRPGSPLLWQDSPYSEPKDLGQRVLEAEPHRRLAYTWHGFQPEHAAHFGWSDEELAARLGERRSKVTFDLTPHGETVRLTVTHDDFSPDSEMHRAISGQLDGSGGWPELLASLKSLLETGQPLPEPVPAG
ncbi:metalloregulator ArsR/SmtB family transcription factor [Micromonospora sp. A3M-1-15]|uniref:ArsR/SmtB family transcription factor n=1 Tax=Micromonospora sp. A3M-1-15 TaxID=2962035 RepID=UPI0020B69D90|nr:metalloregulator ArsR/SmtB family transcription factor [Micromonospora sp. A3M-1-15]MCP3786952.1 metalloregulator ArsR/SmtB family transcription factor [Micromonospora sp. A3M-1-15]